MKDICGNTGRPCSGCQPGACSFRQAHKFTIEQLLNHCSAVCEKEGLWGNVNESRYREHDSVREYLKELQRYKELEAAGRLIELPCKVGDTVHVIRYGKSKPFIIVETHIVEIRNNLHGWVFIPNEAMRGFRIGNFGRTVFLTKEEAEAKLAEQKGGEA